MRVRDLVVATRKGVGERTIGKLESKKPQPTCEDVIVRALAKALSDKEHQIVCHPEFLARWLRPDGAFDEFDKPDPTLVPTPKLQSPQAVPAVTKNAVVVDGEPKRRKLTTNAEIERAIGRHRDTVTVGSASYPLIGLSWVQEIEAQYAELMDQHFAIAGRVTDQRPIPAKASTRLGAPCELGRGAACFKIERAATGGDEQGEQRTINVFPTVFAPKGEHGKQLIRCHREAVEVTLLVHLVVAERNGLKGEDRWEGFIFFEAGKPKPRSWAFVVDEVIERAVSAEKAPKPKSRKSRRTAVAGEAQAE